MAQGWEEINGVSVHRFPVLSYISRLFVYLAGNLSLPGSQHYRTLFNGPIIPGLSRAIQQADYDIAVAASFPLFHMFTTLRAAHRSQRPCILIGCLHPADVWGFNRPMIYRYSTSRWLYRSYYPRSKLCHFARRFSKKGHCNRRWYRHATV